LHCFDESFVAVSFPLLRCACYFGLFFFERCMGGAVSLKNILFQCLSNHTHCVCVLSKEGSLHRAFHGTVASMQLHAMQKQKVQPRTNLLHQVYHQ
jgi:hypothetical protein